MNLIEFLQSADTVALYDSSERQELGVALSEYQRIRQKERNISPLCVKFGDADRYLSQSMKEKGLNGLDYYELVLAVGLAELLLDELKPRHEMGEMGLEWRIQSVNNKLRFFRSQVAYQTGRMISIKD